MDEPENRFFLRVKPVPTSDCAKVLLRTPPPNSDVSVASSSTQETNINPSTQGLAKDISHGVLYLRQSCSLLIVKGGSGTVARLMLLS
jgi:hypothetical protein